MSSPTVPPAGPVCDVCQRRPVACRCPGPRADVAKVEAAARALRDAVRQQQGETFEQEDSLCQLLKPLAWDDFRSASESPSVRIQLRRLWGLLRAPLPLHRHPDEAEALLSEALAELEGATRAPAAHPEAPLPAVTPGDITILAALNQKPNLALTRVQIVQEAHRLCVTSKGQFTPISLRTLSKRLPLLDAQGLTAPPPGKKKDRRITPAGIDVLGRNVQESCRKLAGFSAAG
jgi:hypothetical protein